MSCACCQCLGNGPNAALCECGATDECPHHVSEYTLPEMQQQEPAALPQPTKQQQQQGILLLTHQGARERPRCISDEWYGDGEFISGRRLYEAMRQAWKEGREF